MLHVERTFQISNGFKILNLVQNISSCKVVHTKWHDLPSDKASSVVYITKQIG